MKRVLIIGCGNSLRGDDGLGRTAAESLETLLANPRVEILQTDQLTPELAEPVSRAGLVIIIDASHTGHPGTWTTEDVTISAAGNSKLGHHFTPASILAYASALYHANPRMLLVTVAGRSFECSGFPSHEENPGVPFRYSARLTPEVEAALPDVLRHICALVEREIGAEMNHNHVV